MEDADGSTLLTPAPYVRNLFLKERLIGPPVVIYERST